MAKIDLYDPKWIDMVFADKNKAYGAYQLRKGTAGRNIKALIILLITALLIGGFLAYKVIQQQKDAERQAYMEQMELSKLKEQAKREKYPDLYGNRDCVHAGRHAYRHVQLHPRIHDRGI